jgi:hypothetical protein
VAVRFVTVSCEMSVMNILCVIIYILLSFSFAVNIL